MPPSQDGGTAILAYRLQRLDEDTWVDVAPAVPAGGAVLTARVAVARSRVPYTWRVCAENAVGAGEFGAASEAKETGGTHCPLFARSVVVDDRDRALAASLPAVVLWGRSPE